MAGFNTATPIIDYDAFIFDLDGTLLDTADDLGAALNSVLSAHDQPAVCANVYRPAASNGAVALLEAGFGQQWPTHPQQDALRQQLLTAYADNIALEQQQIKWGIMTNKPEFLTTPLVAAISELSDAQAIVCGDTLNVAKPSPLPLLHTAQLLDVDPSRCLYVGDAERDIIAAKAANMHSAAALWGYIPSEAEALSWQADFNWQSPIDAFNHI